jgi:hypothetical protein
LSFVATTHPYCTDSVFLPARSICKSQHSRIQVDVLSLLERHTDHLHQGRLFQEAEIHNPNATAKLHPCPPISHQERLFGPMSSLQNPERYHKTFYDSIQYNILKGGISMKILISLLILMLGLIATASAQNPIVVGTAHPAPIHIGHGLIGNLNPHETGAIVLGSYFDPNQGVYCNYWSYESRIFDGWRFM